MRRLAGTITRRDPDSQVNTAERLARDNGTDCPCHAMRAGAGLASSCSFGVLSMSRKVILTMAVLFWTAAFIAIPAASAATVELTISYDPVLGTLPNAQGFTLFDTGGSPPYTLVGDSLHQGPTSVPEYQFWHWSCAALSFDFADGFSMQATVKVVSSSYSSEHFRAGFSFGAIDALGRTFAIWIASDRIFIEQNDLIGSSEYLFSTTDDSHTYTFVVNDGVGELFIDGGGTPVLSLGLAPTGLSLDSRVHFGDGTLYGNSETLLTGFSFSVSQVSLPTECDAHTFVTFSDDFNDNYLDLLDWTVSCAALDDGFITESDGVLTTAWPEPNVHTWRGVVTSYAFVGDLDAFRDFDLLSAPGHCGALLCFLSRSGALKNQVCVRRRNLNGAGSYHLTRYVNGQLQILVTLSTGHTSGALRLKRVGTEFTAYYWSAGWHVIGTTSHFSDSGDATLTTHSNSTVSAACDNFQIVADDIFRDCNHNALPDSNEHAGCDGSPWCDDCNENGNLDECDISNCISEDSNGDGVPDECEPAPDLIITAVDLSAVDGDWQTLEISGIASVQITEDGGEQVADSFRVTCFEDTNGNGMFDPTVDQVMGTADVSGLAAGGTHLVGVSVSGTVLFRENLIYAFVDSGEVVVESDESNNYSDSGLVLQRRLAIRGAQTALLDLKNAVSEASREHVAL